MYFISSLPNSVTSPKTFTLIGVFARGPGQRHLLLYGTRLGLLGSSHSSCSYLCQLPWPSLSSLHVLAKDEEGGRVTLHSSCAMPSARARRRDVESSRETRISKRPCWAKENVHRPVDLVPRVRVDPKRTRRKTTIHHPIDLVPRVGVDLKRRSLKMTARVGRHVPSLDPVVRPMRAHPGARAKTEALARVDPDQNREVNEMEKPENQQKVENQDSSWCRAASRLYWCCTCSTFVR